MKREDLQRLMKIEEQINRIAKEELGLSYPDIEYDVVNDKKLLELMAYIIPTNFSHWTYGRDYDKLRTIHEEIQANLPLEMVLNSNPPRAYLSNVNTLGVNALVIAHVVGHVHHFTNNKYFNAQRMDIIDFLARASERFTDYERKYGIEEVEPILDAALALRYHSSPWENETDNERRERLFEQEKKNQVVVYTEFHDFFEDDYAKKVQEDIESYNSKLWMKLKNTIPVEPTEDFLRFIIDNSRILDDWQKDILEVNREVGRYFHANMHNKTMAEGFATITHNKIMNRLFEQKLITNEDYSQYIYSNALVKAQNPYGINPYYVGCGMLEDVEERWNKGRHGEEWDQCRSIFDREEWDTKEGKGWQKVLEVIVSYNDWNFMQEFLTEDVIDKLDLYIYEQVKYRDEVQLRRTAHTAKEIKELIIMSYGFSPFPSIFITDGRDQLVLEHSYYGMELDPKYAVETLKHLYRVWGSPIILKTVQEASNILFTFDGKEARKMLED